MDIKIINNRIKELKKKSKELEMMYYEKEEKCDGHLNSIPTSKINEIEDYYFTLGELEGINKIIFELEQLKKEVQ